jgi:hypothetical protein
MWRKWLVARVTKWLSEHPEGDLAQQELAKWSKWAEEAPEAPQRSKWIKRNSPPKSPGRTNPAGTFRLKRSSSFSPETVTLPPPPPPPSPEQLLHMTPKEIQASLSDQSFLSRHMLVLNSMLQTLINKNVANDDLLYLTELSIEAHAKWIHEASRQDVVLKYTSVPLPVSKCRDVARDRDATQPVTQTVADILIDYSILLSFLSQWSLVPAEYTTTSMPLGMMRQSFWELYFDPDHDTDKITSKLFSTKHPFPGLGLHWSQHQYWIRETTWYGVLDANRFLNDWRIFTPFPRNMQVDKEVSLLLDPVTQQPTYHLYRCPLFIPNRAQRIDIDDRAMKHVKEVTCILCRRVAPPVLSEKEQKKLLKRKEKEDKKNKRMLQRISTLVSLQTEADKLKAQSKEKEMDKTEEEKRKLKQVIEKEMDKTEEEKRKLKQRIEKKLKRNIGDKTSEKEKVAKGPPLSPSGKMKQYGSKSRKTKRSSSEKGTRTTPSFSHLGDKRSLPIRAQREMSLIEAELSPKDILNFSFLTANRSSDTAQFALSLTR